MNEHSVVSRLDQFSSSLQFITLFGHGYSSFISTSSGYNLHNGFLNILYSYGIIGIVNYFIIIVFSTSNLFKIYLSTNTKLSRMSVALTGSLIGILCIGLTTSVIALNHFWIIYALLAVLTNIFKEYSYSPGRHIKLTPALQGWG
jgi:O-antigen ligase